MFYLRKLRKEKNITMKQLANYLKISESAISQYENEKREPDYNTLCKLADYFGVSVDYLLGRTDLNEEPLLYVPENVRNTPIAFSGGLEDLTQEDLNEVSNYIEYLKNRKKNNTR